MTNKNQTLGGEIRKRRVGIGWQTIEVHLKAFALSVSEIGKTSEDFVQMSDTVFLKGSLVKWVKMD